MPNKALIFMPYDPKDECYFAIRHEYADNGRYEKNKKVKQYLLSKGYAVSIAWYDGSKLPDVSSFDTGEIYIRGHGMPGEPTVKGAKSFAEEVDYKTVLKRLKESGLPQSFQGQIHCYNCHSAEHSPDKKGEPYAVLFSDHMFTEGYRACSYYGYLGSLDSFAKDGSQGTNIYAREQGAGELGTWEQARIRIHPKVKLRSNRQRLKSYYRKKVARFW